MKPTGNTFVHKKSKHSTMKIIKDPGSQLSVFKCEIEQNVEPRQNGNSYSKNVKFPCYMVGETDNKSRVVRRPSKHVFLKIMNEGINDIKDIDRPKSRTLVVSNNSNNQRKDNKSSETAQHDIHDDESDVQEIGTDDLIGYIAFDHSYARNCKRIHFGQVSVFYFSRRQGSCTVPTDGEISVGMEMKHSDYKRFKLSEYEEAKAKEKSDKPDVNMIFTDEIEKKISNSIFLDFAFNQPSWVGERLCDFLISSSATDSNGLFSSPCLDSEPDKKPLQKHIFQPSACWAAKPQ